MKKILKISLLATLILPFVAISCANKDGDKILNNLREHEYFVDKKIQDSVSRAHMDLTDVERKDLRGLPSNLLSDKHSKMISGTFGEKRKFYSEKSFAINAHTGIDVVLPVGTKIISPVNGKLIASYWYNLEASNFAAGIGGVSVIETNLKDLNIPKELKEFIYIKEKHAIKKIPKMVIMNGKKINPLFSLVSKEEYEKYLNGISQSTKEKIDNAEGKVILTFMHLSKNIKRFRNSSIVSVSWGTSSKNTLIIDTSISPKDPIILKRGDEIGKVGTVYDNGGWIAHSHINAYYGEGRFFSRLPKYKFSLSKYEKKDFNLLKRVWINAHPIGIKKLAQKTQNKDGILHDLYIHNNLFDPNHIYDLYDKNSIEIKL